MSTLINEPSQINMFFINLVWISWEKIAKTKPTIFYWFIIIFSQISNQTDSLHPYLEIGIITLLFCYLFIFCLLRSLDGHVQAMAWTYARGDHMTKEHILVYWLAPIKATILAVWTFKLLGRAAKSKSDWRNAILR